MDYALNRRSLLAHAATGTAAGAVGFGRARAQATSDEFASLIEAERAAIKAGMIEASIGAAAICMVHRGRPVWLEGFGQNAAWGGRPVGSETLFSIQSTTKNITAVAVLLAVQEGLLDLDAPITRYLPDFSVNSRFEPSPQERITLRLLLGNRAGFTHEAPIGNNYEPASPSFGAHVHSISDTWLRFPVGDRYRYSNLGYDLAGYIVGKQSGLGYAEWLQRKLFEPLRMHDSTADPAVYSKCENRAVGNHRGYAQVPLATPLVASGGVWTSARDMATYLAFLISRGRWQGRQVLAPELWTEMHGFGFGGDYSLGVMRTELRHGSTPIRLLHHRGGGFGFGCNLVYCPDAELGWAALFNRPALAGYRFGANLIEQVLSARFGPRAPRLSTSSLAPIHPHRSRVRALLGSYVGRNVRGEIIEVDGALRFRRAGSNMDVQLGMTAPDEVFTVGAGSETTVYRYHPPTPLLPAHLECSQGEESLDHNGGQDDPIGPHKPAWDRYVGRYAIDQWGSPSMEVVIEWRRGYLYIDGVKMMIETEPGLFFASDGEAIDFRSSVPTWRNLLLRRLRSNGQ